MSEPTLEELKAMVDKLEAEAATAATPEPQAEKPVRQRKAAVEAPAVEAPVEAQPVTAINHTTADGTTLTASIDDGGGVAVQIERAGHVVHKFDLAAEKVLREVV